MRIITLHKVPRSVRPSDDGRYVDIDDIGEPQQQPQEQPAAEPVAISPDAIRCFYKRRADRGPGTRITFKDGGGFAVTESYDEVYALVAGH